MRLKEYVNFNTMLELTIDLDYIAKIESFYYKDNQGKDKPCTILIDKSGTNTIVTELYRKAVNDWKTFRLSTNCEDEHYEKNIPLNVINPII